MTHALRLRPASTPAMLAVWDDAATLCHALAFEAALARAEAAEGLIAVEVADTITRACDRFEMDAVAFAEEAALAGTLAIPMVHDIRARLDSDAAAALHRGATSQDVADTILVLQVRAAAKLVGDDVRRILAALARQARDHATTPAIGRTLLQDALPIAFGLRLAQWHRGTADALRGLDRSVNEGAVLQLGGAAGTRAGLEGRGVAIARRVGETLDLPPAPPWHARRTGTAAIASAVGILIGALAKMARDVTLLAQDTVGELREPHIPGRGGSSAMAHKRNPTGSVVALAAAHRAPGLVAGVLAGLPAEEERGLGGWQAEGPALADLFLLAGGSAAAMATVAEGLEINRNAIARNLAAAGPEDNPGEDMGESAALIAALLGD